MVELDAARSSSDAQHKQRESTAYFSAVQTSAPTSPRRCTTWVMLASATRHGAAKLTFEVLCNARNAFEGVVALIQQAEHEYHDQHRATRAAPLTLSV